MLRKSSKKVLSGNNISPPTAPAINLSPLDTLVPAAGTAIALVEPPPYAARMILMLANQFGSRILFQADAAGGLDFF